MKSLLIGFSASLALIALPNTVLANYGMLEFCGLAKQQNLFIKKDISAPILPFKYFEKRKLIPNLYLGDLQSFDKNILNDIMPKTKPAWADPKIVEHEKNKAIELKKRAYYNKQKNASSFELSFNERLQLPPIDQNFINDAAVIF